MFFLLERLESHDTTVTFSELSHHKFIGLSANNAQEEPQKTGDQIVFYSDPYCPLGNQMIPQGLCDSRVANSTSARSFEVCIKKMKCTFSNIYVDLRARLRLYSDELFKQGNSG